MSLLPAISRLREKKSLSPLEAKHAFDAMFSGATSEDEMAKFLLALKDKGESAEEILGAVTSMRARALTIEAPPDAIDIVGTGGDLRGTFNVSTAAAFVVAGCGVPVAKHGNRAVTSKSGSSDVLVALGINLEPEMALVQRCLAEANLCFLFAPRHHPAMKHVAAVRKKLGVRTIFNLLGPLTNPANVKKHLIGVYSKDKLRPMAETLRALGSHAAWLTHGQDGMDEITTTTASDVVALKDGAITEFSISPDQGGIETATLLELTGGNADENAVAIHRLLLGEKSAHRNIVVLNAAAALVLAGKTENLRDGAAMAAESLDSGAARAILQKVTDITNRAFA